MERDSKGIRLDVFVEDDKNTVYNIEIQTTSIKYLPRRIRYYKGLIDISILDAGQSYKALKQSFVIFFCTYDPFGKGYYRYTFEERCLENLEVALGDGTQVIVLNTKGTVGEISDEWKDLLSYMDGNAPGTDDTRGIDSDVEEVKASDERRHEYMVMMERDRQKIDLGIYTKTGNCSVHD